MEIPGLALDDLFVGAKVTILSRCMKVTDYGDVRTKTRFEANRTRTFAMIKPDSYANIGKIIDTIYASGFEINKLKMSKYSERTAAQFYAEHVGKGFFANLSNMMTSDVCVGLELVAPDAVAKWRQVIGPTNSVTAKAQAPTTIRGRFGTDGTRNAVHGSDSAVSFKRESDFWFGGNNTQDRPMQTTAVMNNCTLCLIKPHILKEGLAG
jgi:nucleoside-diphosphate kinase